MADDTGSEQGGGGQHKKLYVCFCCGEEGHREHSCRHKEKIEKDSDHRKGVPLRCRRCKTLGHLDRACADYFNRTQDENSVWADKPDHIWKYALKKQRE